MHGSVDSNDITMIHFCFSCNYLNSSWVELNVSRGHESYSHKVFMRNSGMLIVN